MGLLYLYLNIHPFCSNISIDNLDVYLFSTYTVPVFCKGEASALKKKGIILTFKNHASYI